MFEDFFADRILPCTLSESKKVDCDLHKGIFSCGRVIIYFMHAMFKLLTYNQNVSDDNFNTMYTLFYLQK